MMSMWTDYWKLILHTSLVQYVGYSYWSKNGLKYVSVIFIGVKDLSVILIGLKDVSVISISS